MKRSSIRRHRQANSRTWWEVKHPLAGRPVRIKDEGNLTDFEAYELVQMNDPAVLNTTNRLLTLARCAALDPMVSDSLSLPSEQALH